MSNFLHTLHIAQNLLLSGPIIGATCSLLSVYVVLRRMALISEGVSHAAFGGFCAAILVGYWLPFMDNLLGWQIVAGAFCIATALLIGFVSRKKRVSEDSAIGIFLVTSLALGYVLLRARQLLGGTQPPNAESLLFGDFLNVTRTDLAVVSIVLLLIVAIITALYHQFLYTTLDEEMARVNGVNTRLINTLLLMMISVVIVVCVRMVGSLIITALMIIPGATGNMISRKFSGVLIASLVIGTLGTSAATWLALVPPFDRFSPGPLVVLILFLVFASVWTFRHFVKPRAVHPDAVPTPEPVHQHPSAFGHGHAH